MRKIQFIFVFILLTCILPAIVLAQEAEESTGRDVMVEHVFFNPDHPAPCITQAQYRSLEQECAANIQRLGLPKARPDNILTTTFNWPQKASPNLTDCGFHFIGAFVDQDTAATTFKDFTCGANTYDGHHGTDIAIWPFGFYKMDNSQVQVVAAAAGTIVQRADGNFDRNCGSNNLTANSIILQHADGSFSLYWHMKKNSVTSKAVGQTVAVGEYLGMVGSSGSSSGPHLHFEVWSGSTANTYKDPYAGACNYLNANSWWFVQKPYLDPAILKVSVNTTDIPVPVCPNTEVSNESDSFLIPFQGVGLSPGYAKFVVFERQLPVGAMLDLKILNPDGSLFLGWTYNVPTYYRTSYLNWSKKLPLVSGTYLFQATYNGSTCSKHFVVLTAADIPNVVDSIKTCSGNNLVFTSGYTGNNHWQWQKDSANVFVNLSNGAVFSGVTADTLHLTNPPTSWYGQTFRCVINDTSYSKKFVLKFSSNWTGFISTAWETPGNWSCGIVPDANTDAVVQTGMPYYPIVNVNTSCRSVQTAGSTSSITIKTGVKLTLTGK